MTPPDGMLNGPDRGVFLPAGNAACTILRRSNRTKARTMAGSGSDNFRDRLCRLTRDRQGATAIEYGLIAALVGVAITASLPLLKGRIALTFLQAQVYLDHFTTR